MDELPELIIEPLEEGKKHHYRKGSAKTKRKLNELRERMGSGHNPNQSVEKAHQTREYEIATAMYQMLLEGKSDKDIAKHFECHTSVVRKYLDIKLQEAQDGLIRIRATHALVGYDRLERYVIEPSIKKIISMMESDNYDQRPYDTLMKAIKLQAELVAPKGSINMNNHGQSTIINTNGNLYAITMEAMRREGEIDLEEVVIDASDIDVSDYRIPKVDRMIDED